MDSQGHIYTKGIITLNSRNGTGKRAIVRISKDNVKYDYALADGAHYPLQLGNRSNSV
ncbi:hypothetical protein ACFFK0_23420 [Paenibacillus chartarius]|uniref:Uncharacterized protein n=1 Tax=Paenibacillus chartarius TaxID=747481 RepID=A0ABV6DRS9_9BACL